jgi:hypothetical protein
MGMERLLDLIIFVFSPWIGVKMEAKKHFFFPLKNYLGGNRLDNG